MVKRGNVDKVEKVRKQNKSRQNLASCQNQEWFSLYMSVSDKMTSKPKFWALHPTPRNHYSSSSSSLSVSHKNPRLLIGRELLRLLPIGWWLNEYDEDFAPHPRLPPFLYVLNAASFHKKKTSVKSVLWDTIWFELDFLCNPSCLGGKVSRTHFSVFTFFSFFRILCIMTMTCHQNCLGGKEVHPHCFFKLFSTSLISFFHF